ncbi:cupin-like domain-containing protein [Parvularcula sp. LCG005]|uniref:cupin-like domain-containing protein n=1 Tax=Parvularcula sp. LCG005 TaxID=3078805 RepID=UPI002941FBB2|nr:cupin-like domain-containing protein [Parvularcula sp. LCG005]WOI52657.1 cupin-like domain-containing protein [Parvularcula sp. LCG005]
MTIDTGTLATVREFDGPRMNGVPDAVASSSQPVILRDWVSHWPLVTAAKTSPRHVFEELAKYDRGAVVPVTVGSPAVRGRVFYNDDFTGFNVDRGNAAIGQVLRRILDHGDGPNPPLVYLASADIDDVLPGLSAQNAVSFEAVEPLASIWIGTRTRIAAHNDLPRNLACVAAGRRRFILFPPEQVKNLYVGPFELTPAGRPISLVDFEAPDLNRFPRFEDAWASGQVAELGPGDALFIPSMWWHHVQALDAFNVLINYWWRTVPAHLGTPQDVLNHAIMTLRDMPDDERQIWKMLFGHYIFDADETVADHIPEDARGSLAPISPDMARTMRDQLRQRLNR